MDTLVVICFSLVFGLLGLLAYLLVRVRNAPEEEEVCEPPNESEQQPTTSRSTVSSPNELRVGSKVIKSRNSKTPVKRTPVSRAPEEGNEQNGGENNDENGEQFNSSTAASPSVMEGKIGKKKLQKLGECDAGEPSVTASNHRKNECSKI